MFFLLLSVGELNENKNHETVIRALAEINDPSIHYAIAGKGRKKDYLEQLAKDKGVKLHLLGYRNDVAELDKAADAFIHPSYREGLNVSVMEAMAAGLPIICGRIRGNVDLVSPEGGCLFDPRDISECVNSIKAMRMSKSAKMGLVNRRAVQKLHVDDINERMVAIYGFPSNEAMKS